MTFDLSFLSDRSAVKRMAAIALACGLLGAVYALCAPQWFSSVLTVVPAKQQRSGFSSLLGPDLSAFAGGFDGALGGSAEVSRIAAVLQSIQVTDAVIAKLDLRTRYRTKYLEDARVAVWQHCNVRTLSKPGLVQLSCEDKDPAFAKTMLDYFAEFGNQVFRGVSTGTAAEEVRFLEKHVAELRRQADESGARMREFQELHGIVDLDTQSRAVVSAMTTLNSLRLSKQLELDYLRRFSSADEASTRALESQLSVMDGQLRGLAEKSAPSDSRSGGKRGGSDRRVFPAALEVPRLRAEYEKLYRDRKVSEASLIFALERLEGARASEARDVSTFLVLDPPTVPTKRSRPRRVQIVLTCALSGLFLAAAYGWWRDGVRRGSLPDWPRLRA